MERFIVFALGTIIAIIGVYLIAFNVPITGNFVDEYGNWHHSNIGGTFVLCISVFILYTAFIMKPDKKKR